jgi:hypothetical protein
MDKQEKIAQVKELMNQWLDSDMLRGKHDHVSNSKGLGINDIKNYFPNKEAPFGAFVYKLYKEKLDIAIPRTPPYSMVDTQAYIETISYSQLTEEDADTLYKRFILKIRD